MQVMTHEFLLLKMAVGIVEEHAEDLTELEKRTLAQALEAVGLAEKRQAESNAKQARYMKQRRHNLQR